MQNKKVWLVGIAVVVIVAGYFVFSIDKGPHEPIRVGLVMPLSGDLANIGTNVRHGLEIAFAESGLSSSDVEIFYEDTGGFTPGAALTSFKKLITQNNVDVVIGPLGPAQVLTIAPDLVSNPITVIAVSNCDDRFKKYPTLFCIYPGLRAQVDHELDFMQRRGWRNIYLFTEQSEFGILIEEMLKEHADIINLVGVEKVVAGTTKDFRTQIAKAVAAEPDVVFGVFAPAEGTIMLRQYPSLSKDTPLYIAFDINNDQLRDLFGENAPGIYFGALMSSEYDPLFVSTYKDLYDAEPDYLAALAHSSATLLFDVLKKDDLRTDDLPDHLIGITGDTGVNGFRFNADRTISIPLYTYEFKGGELVPYEE